MQDTTWSAVEALFIDALSSKLTRRLSERIVADVRRQRRDAPLPTEIEPLLAIVRHELLEAACLRLGARAPAVIADVEERVLAMAAVPAPSWEPPRVRVIVVAEDAARGRDVARAIGAGPIVRVAALHELLVALESKERTLVVVDPMDPAIDAAWLARFVPDFPSDVTTLLVGATPALRVAYLESGAAFRTTLRAEPLDHPEVVAVLRELAAGATVPRATRRPRGESTTTTSTDPRRAA